MLTKSLQSVEGQTGQSGFGREGSKPAGVPSVISDNLKIVGDLHCVGDVQIDGTVEGDITTETATVGQSAKIQGSVSGDTLRIHGSVNGQIKASTVIISKTAHVVGDIIHETLSIEAGAYLDGFCRRFSADASGSKATVASIEPAQVGKES